MKLEAMCQGRVYKGSTPTYWKGLQLTQYGPIKTDHILFIASGAFQLAKPSDLLQSCKEDYLSGFELDALNSDDFKIS